LGFPTGWSFTTQQATSFLAPLLGIEEEEAPTSTTLSHVNYTPAAKFSGAVVGEKSGRPLQGEFFACTSFTLL
jgi:hypothetical protein